MAPSRFVSRAGKSGLLGRFTWPFVAIEGTGCFGGFLIENNPQVDLIV